MKEINTNKDIKVSDLKKGSESAYKKIYSLYYNDLCSYVFNFTNDKDLSEDIVQNVIFAIWKNKHKLNIHNSLKAYLYKSCYNEFIDTYKRQKKQIDYVTSVKITTLNTFFDEDTNNFSEKRVLQVQKAIEKLPKKCKEVFTLTKIEGLKYREVADRMKISVKTVEAHMGLAIRKIKEQVIIIITLLLHFFY